MFLYPLSQGEAAYLTVRWRHVGMPPRQKTLETGSNGLS
jgi:hypothetical protein